MSHNPNPTRKRPREDDEEDEDENPHRPLGRHPPQQRFEHVSTHDHARQHNGDQYHGSVTIYHGAGVTTGASKSPETTPVERALKSLRFEQIDARYLTIEVPLTTSSCRWLLDQPGYKNWRDVASISENHGFLWIKGKAGAGKSTLMKFAVDNAEKTRCEDQTIVSFFFNARGVLMEKSVSGMYRALLYQIIHKIPRLGHLLCKERTLSAQSQGWPLGGLRSVFQDVVESLEQDHLICYVDALDECQEDEVREMVEFFEELGEFSVEKQTRFHVCFASRHYPRISLERAESIVMDVECGHRDDIFSYIKKKLKISNSSLRADMLTEIMARSSGVFLWVTLVVRILNEECNHGNAQAVRARLETISTELGVLIQDILLRGKPTKNLIPLLQCVSYSRRPLTPEELFIALHSTEPETIHDAHTPEALARSNVENFILSASKGLAEITKGRNPRVQFIHEIVRSYFLDPNHLAKLDLNLQTNPSGQGHDQLKRCCYNYLTSDPCSRVALPAVLLGVRSSEGKALRRQTIGALPFLQYALDNVLYHTNTAHDLGVDQHAFIEEFPSRIAEASFVLLWLLGTSNSYELFQDTMIT